MQVADHLDRLLWLGKPETLLDEPLMKYASTFDKDLEQIKDEAEVLWKHRTWAEHDGKLLALNQEK